MKKKMEAKRRKMEEQKIVNEEESTGGVELKEVVEEVVDTNISEVIPEVVEAEIQETSETTTHDYRKAPEVTVTPDIVEAKKDLTELKQIGEEITKLEERLGTVPDPAQPQIDPKKYNRKQRRKMERQMKHQQKAEQKQAEQKGSTFATRKDLVNMHQSMQKIRDRLYYVDILTGALEKLLISKIIISEEEVANCIPVLLTTFLSNRFIIFCLSATTKTNSLK